MAQRDLPEDQVQQSRERLTSLAEAIARRADGERLKELAKAKALELEARAKELASTKAHEVSAEITESVKQATVYKAQRAVDRASDQVKEQAMDSKSMGMVGAVAGATAGVVIARRIARRKTELGLSAGVPVVKYSYSELDTPGVPPIVSESIEAGTMPIEEERIGGPGVDLGGRIEGAKDQISGAFGTVEDKASRAYGAVQDKASSAYGAVQDKASSAYGAVQDKVSGSYGAAQQKAAELKGKVREMGEALPSAAEVRAGASSFVDQAVSEQPLILALGALVLGGIAGLLLPVTDRERRAFGPIKTKAVAGVEKLGDSLSAQLDVEGCAKAEGAGGSVETEQSAGIGGGSGVSVGEERAMGVGQPASSTSRDEVEAMTGGTGDIASADVSDSDVEGERAQGILDPQNPPSIH